MRTFLGVNVIHIHIGGTGLSRVKRRHKMLSAAGNDKAKTEKMSGGFGNGIVAARQPRDMKFQGRGAD